MGAVLARLFWRWEKHPADGPASTRWQYFTDRCRFLVSRFYSIWSPVVTGRTVWSGPLGTARKRLIGTIRREYLDQTLFWTAADLEQKLRLFQDYFNQQRVHSGLGGRLPDSQKALTLLKFD